MGGEDIWEHEDPLRGLPYGTPPIVKDADPDYPAATKTTVVPPWNRPSSGTCGAQEALVTTEMLLFHGENHEFRGAASPPTG